MITITQESALSKLTIKDTLVSNNKASVIGKTPGLFKVMFLNLDE